MCNTQTELEATKKQAAFEHQRWLNLHQRFMTIRDQLYAKLPNEDDVRLQAMVRNFHKLLNLPAPDKHTLLDEQARKRRFALIMEEATELLQATKPTDQLDAIVDLLYVVLGTAVEMGLHYHDLGEAFSIVHESNMAKVGGKLREDGKLLKPEGWKPPVLEGIFNPQ